MFRFVLLACLLCIAHAFTPKMAKAGASKVLRSYKSTTLYSVESPGYDYPWLVLNVTGDTRYDMGYAYGYLMYQEIPQVYEHLLNSVFKSKIEQEVIEAFLDIEYDMFLHKQIPEEYREELRGVDAGGVAQGAPGNIKMVTRSITLSNFPGDVVANIEWLIRDELNGNASDIRLAREAAQRVLELDVDWSKWSMSCSHFGVWGSRTDTGRLFSGRNLDWDANTGIAEWKMLSIFHPPASEGKKYSHVAIGYAGEYGALTGFSAKGITVHEAGDDNDRETFLGFPWILRLRYIMENAANMQEALTLWKSTNNTLGINHGLGSAVDRVYTALETCAGYTAYFQDDDPREKASPYGEPLKECVWRTNHAYDPTFLATATGRQKGGHKPDGDSLVRYQILHDTFQYYADSKTVITPLQAVNLSAIVGDKGGSKRPSFLTCEEASAVHGSNIISVAFDPENQLMYLANENGRNKSHTPACCNNYLEFNMAPYFSMSYQ